jgi:hypothetical protein
VIIDEAHERNLNRWAPCLRALCSVPSRAAPCTAECACTLTWCYARGTLQYVTTALGWYEYRLGSDILIGLLSRAIPLRNKMAADPHCPEASYATLPFLVRVLRRSRGRSMKQRRGGGGGACRRSHMGCA